MNSNLKEFIKYTVFNVLGMIGLSCYILADTFFISFGLGANGLAALNLALPVYSVINGSGLMLGIGGATKYAIMKNQGNKKFYEYSVYGNRYWNNIFLNRDNFFGKYSNAVGGK